MQFPLCGKTFHCMETTWKLLKPRERKPRGILSKYRYIWMIMSLPDTWFRPPFWDLLMLQLLRPNSSNLPCLYSTFHLEYPLVLSRFSLKKYWSFNCIKSMLYLSWNKFQFFLGFSGLGGIISLSASSIQLPDDAVSLITLDLLQVL